MQARDIMTENPVCCRPEEFIVPIANRMQDNNIGALPVVDGDGILIGMITDRDIVCRFVAHGGDAKIATVGHSMSKGKIWTVKQFTHIDEVIEKMEEGQVRRIPVVDDDGKVIGIISTADIALELDDPEMITEVFEGISEPPHLTPR